MSPLNDCSPPVLLMRSLRLSRLRRPLPVQTRFCWSGIPSAQHLPFSTLSIFPSISRARPFFPRAFSVYPESVILPLQATVCPVANSIRDGIQLITIFQSIPTSRTSHISASRPIQSLSDCSFPDAVDTIANATSFPSYLGENWVLLTREAKSTSSPLAPILETGMLVMDRTTQTYTALQARSPISSVETSATTMGHTGLSLWVADRPYISVNLLLHNTAELIIIWTTFGSGIV